MQLTKAGVVGFDKILNSDFGPKYIFSALLFCCVSQIGMLLLQEVLCEYFNRSTPTGCSSPLHLTIPHIEGLHEARCIADHFQCAGLGV